MGFSVVSREWGRISGKPPLMTPPGLRTMHARLHLDSAKAQAELGIAFRPLQETLADTVAFDDAVARGVFYLDGHKPDDGELRTWKLDRIEQADVDGGEVVVYSPIFDAAGLATLMRGNVIAALMATFFGNPLTYVPIGVISLKTGPGGASLPWATDSARLAASQSRTLRPASSSSVGMRSIVCVSAAQRAGRAWPGAWTNSGRTGPCSGTGGSSWRPASNSGRTSPTALSGSSRSRISGVCGWASRTGGSGTWSA